ncbi:MAG TPA: LysR family transcriptional regulator [Burkholderiaceae bacterium]|nr:LysR family transcriptional regulator [Burkholderiaceae bacterium]
MNIEKIYQIDLNLLRLFAEVYDCGSVSVAAERLGISQPAASNGLARLRTVLGNALFARAHGGVRPTPMADHLIGPVRSALAQLTDALRQTYAFDPPTSRRHYRMHMSDIGEARFLPALMAALQVQAPGTSVECHAMPHGGIAEQLDKGELDFAFGFLPSVTGTEHVTLMEERYVLMLREAHPLAVMVGQGGPDLAALSRLSFVAVRSHSDTLRMLEILGLRERIKLFASNFLALPAIVRDTDLAVIMPSQIATEFNAGGGYIVVAPQLPLRDFTVSLHWSRRQHSDPSHMWMRELICGIFATP